MFPSNFIESTATENETEETGIDFLFDYEKGQHIMRGAVLSECDELQSIRQYIQNVLRTKANLYMVYTKSEDTIFGISVYEYLGTRTLPTGYLNSELKRDIEELKNNMSLQRSVLASSASIQTNHGMASFPINNSQKVINAALDFYNAPEEAKEVILSKKLVPTDDSFRFYAARDNDGNTIVLDATRNKTCKGSPSGCFRVGASQIPYYLNVETVNKFKCKFSDM